MTALLSVQTKILPFKNIEELVEFGAYKLLLCDIGTETSYFNVRGLAKQGSSIYYGSILGGCMRFKCYS